jgi:TolA-binding protein
MRLRYLKGRKEELNNRIKELEGQICGMRGQQRAMKQDLEDLKKSESSASPPL